MINSLLKIALFLCAMLFMAGTVSAANSRVQLIYFYSAECPPCEQTTPVVLELSREYTVEGIVFGDNVSGRMPFTVRKGTTADKQRYSVRNMPSLVVLRDGKMRQVLRTEHDIKFCRTIIKGVELGALTVTEAVLDRSQHTKTVVGLIKSKGEYFKGTQFYLTDPKNAIEVKPWLPLESIKSPVKGKRPRLMFDVIDQQVILEGDVIKKTGGTVIFTVRKELSIE